MCAYWHVGPSKADIHIGCAEKTVEVFKVLAVGNGGFFFDIDMPQIDDLMDGSDIGDGYTITKEAMTALKYYSLPEFDGF